MLDEKRIRQMTKLAFFEKKGRKKMPYESAAIFGVITSEKSF